MQSNPLLSNIPPARSKRWLLAPMIVFGLLLAAVFVTFRWMSSLNTHRIFRLTGTSWEEVPPIPYNAGGLRVSSRGTVWALVVRKCGLSRWDGAAWRYYKETEAGIRDCPSGFEVDGEQVWFPTGKGILRFDGNNWRRYEEAAVSGSSSIVAAGDRAWTVDSAGKFLTFDRNRWRNEQLALPGVKWDEESDPKLVRTDDGALWLEQSGIWRFDGVAWKPVAAGAAQLKDAGLLGASGDRVWLQDEQGIRSVSMDGKKWTLYSATETGLEYAASISPAGGRIWFAGWDRLVEFDGVHWRRIDLPLQKGARISSMTAGANGTVWVASLDSRGFSQAYRWAGRLTLLLTLAIFGAIVWTMRLARRRQLENHQRVSQAVRHATGDVPEELEMGERRLKSSWQKEVAWWVVILGGYFVLRIFWPQAPGWLVPAAGIAIHLAFVIQESVVKRKPKPYDPIGPGAPSGYDWGKTWKAAGGTMLVVLLVNANRIPGLRDLPVSWFWVVVVLLIGSATLMTAFVNAAFRRGNYDAALHIIRWFHFYNPSGAEALRLSGQTLLFAGRYREAEDALRRGLAGSHASVTYGSALENLGDALMEQGRYDEAMRSYEAALLAFPWRRRPYRGMAEMQLRRGQNVEQALKYIELIIDFTGLSWREQAQNGRAKDDYWSLKAWALAASGRSSEVLNAIREALKVTDPKSKPDLAVTHYRAGMAMQALGEIGSANEHFRAVIAHDPDGRRGTLAKAAMREGSRVWGSVKTYS